MSDTCVNHIERHWQTLTVLNNKLFDKGDFKKALFGYKDALYIAEVLNNNMSDCIRLNTLFIQVYIISCNNLAHTYSELGNKEEAENMLKRVLFFLLHLTTIRSISQVNGTEIQSELKQATLAYVDFSEKNNVTKTKQEKLFTTLKNQLQDHDFKKLHY